MTRCDPADGSSIEAHQITTDDTEIILFSGEQSPGEWIQSESSLDLAQCR